MSFIPLFLSQQASDKAEKETTRNRKCHLSPGSEEAEAVSSRLEEVLGCSGNHTVAKINLLREIHAVWTQKTKRTSALFHQNGCKGETSILTSFFYGSVVLRCTLKLRYCITDMLYC